jgi:TatD DNase family protein
MKYIDIHCHLHFEAYDADRDAVIDRARQAEVGMIVVGIDAETSRQAVALAASHDNTWAVIGLHPVDASIGFDAGFYEQLAAHPKVVGIGECGMDYFHVDSRTKIMEKKLQEQVFRAQIALAEKVKKPLMLHIRSSATEDAYKNVLAILREARASGAYTQAGDVHFFAGSLDYARQFIELGFSLSFTGVITFAKEYHEVVKTIPLDRIMSETDAPFVSPAPYRGQRNEPGHVIEVAKAIASIRGEDEQTVFAQLLKNARTLFKI